jgi:signal transduction histidine kinase
MEEEHKDAGNKVKFLQAIKSPVFNLEGKVIGTQGMAFDITERKQAEVKLAEAHRELITTSRQAGMAEVATSVLHNVGNVLNSVNIAANLISETLKKSKSANIARVAALMREHEADLGEYMMNDPKGKQVPEYLTKLAEHLATEQNSVLKESESLRQHIEHIKNIVAMQQSYAKVSGVTEIVKVADLVEDALRLNAGGLGRNSIHLVREFDPHVPEISVEKHKVLQILVNLIRNANHACNESGREEKRLTVRVSNGGETVYVSIADNGVGIPPENLTRIFNHGFTTRKGGHGFGLHSGALAAKEMGGALVARSEGPGKGATFTLELPLKPKK